MQEVIVIAITSIVGLVVGVGTYLLRRLQALEQQDSQHDAEVRKERDELKKRVSELETDIKTLRLLADRVPELERQVGVLTKALETTNQQLESTKATLSEYQTRLDDAEKLAEAKQDKIDRLSDELAAMRGKNHELEQQVKTYENALTLLGQQLMQNRSDGAEAGESPNGADEPQEKNDGKSIQ